MCAWWSTAWEVLMRKQALKCHKSRASKEGVYLIYYASDSVELERAQVRGTQFCTTRASQDVQNMWYIRDLPPHFVRCINLLIKEKEAELYLYNQTHLRYEISDFQSFRLHTVLENKIDRVRDSQVSLCCYHRIWLGGARFRSLWRCHSLQRNLFLVFFAERKL